MQIPVGLGLSTLDRSMFGFKKADRSLTSPSPDDEGFPADELKAAPRLPPLGILNSNNSFANLLSQLDKPTTSDVCPTSPTISSGPATPMARARITASSLLLPQFDLTIQRSTEHLEFATDETHFSKLARIPTGALPERQQSSSTAASYSKRSDGSSISSTSSRSSIDEDPVKPIPLPSLNSVVIPAHDKDFFSNGFGNLKLNVEPLLNPANVTLISPLNTNKALPQAPWSELEKQLISELDSATVKQTRSQIASRHEVSFLSNTEQKLAGIPQLHTDLPALSSSMATLPQPPARNPARLRTRDEDGHGPLKLRTSADIPERVRLNLMSSLSSITDLQAMALVGKEFYHSFKRNESEVVERVLQTESPQAWELRQLVRGEQRRTPFQMKAIQRDVAALRALQAFMMMKCTKLCRRTTIDGLAGDDFQRRKNLENALWKIWTFCKLFGKGASRDARIHVQIMWLQGKSLRDRNDKSLSRIPTSTKAISRMELEDMSEMWRCMEALLSDFRGREAEARRAGIFDQCKIDEDAGQTETQYLEDWIYDILSVGPKAVLTMISCSFEHAQVLGVTKWTPPRSEKSRRFFLKTALEQVYRDCLVAEARLKAERLAKSVQRQTSEFRPTSRKQAPLKKAASAPGTMPKLVTEQSLTQYEERRPTSQRLEIRPDCDPDAQLADDHENAPVVSPTTNPASFTSLAMMSNASARLGATLFPIHHNRTSLSQMRRSAHAQHDSDDSTDHDILPKVVDPIDRALSLLVKQLGFPVTSARQALAMSDDGAGINVQRAVELLSSDRRLKPFVKDARIAELSSHQPIPRSSRQSDEFCEGTCRRVSVVQRRKSHLRGFISRHSFRQSFPLTAILDREDEDSAIHQLAKQTIMPVVASSTPPTQEATAERRPAYQNLTEFIRYRNSIRLPRDQIDRNSFAKGHKKSSSTGTIDFADEASNNSLSPISPLTPVSGLGGFVAIRPISQQISDADNEQSTPTLPKPKVTLTRVGTGRRPSKRISLRKSGTMRPGEPPEIIGFTY